MSDKDKTAAYETLGLKPGATETEVKVAYEKLMAFWSAGDALSESLKKIAAGQQAKISEAYKTLSSTTSGGVTPGPQGVSGVKSGGGLGKPWEWLLFIAIVGGVGYMAYQEDQEKHKGQENPQPPIQIEKPRPPEPEKPPDYAAPMLHNGIAAAAVKWRTEDLARPGSNRMGVMAYDAQDRLINYLTFYQQEHSTGWEFYEQWVVRYSDNGQQIGVTHYQPKWQSDSYTFKDERNISEVGDVQVRTTIYFYNSYGSRNVLDKVTCTSPFSENYDGLEYQRDSNGQLQYVIRKPNGNPIRLEANRDHLDRMFDLWRYFGQYN